MSYDDIRAALESATRQPWVVLYPGQCCEGYCIESEDGRDAVAHGLEGSVSDLDLITSAPTWLTELLAEVESLARWKTEALPVITGLQELGSALGIPLGKRITGPDALAAVKALTTRAEAAEQSSCFFCPFHRPSAWQDLARETPELFERSVQLEDTLNVRRAQLGKDPVYLTRFGVPLRQAIALDQDVLPADPADGACDSGWCFTWRTERTVTPDANGGER